MQPSERAGARGLSPIGNHLPTLGPSGGAVGSPTPKSRTNSTVSGITGSPALAKAGAKPIGTPRSEIGSAEPPTTEAGARTVLATETLGEVDANLRAWLAPSVRSSLTSVTRWRESPGTGEHNEPYTAGFELHGEFGEGDARDALRLAELLNAPASPSDCTMSLGKLRTITVTREVTREDLIIQIAAMTEELCAYPLDVVLDACRASARSSKFFPTWAELWQLCEERVLFRRALARELRRHLDAIEKGDPAQESPPAKVPPAVAVWRDNREQLEALAAWPVLQRCIPDSDDGDTLTLAVEAPGLGFAVLAWAAQQAGPIIGREIACVVRSWVQPALFERKVQIGGAPSAEPHRRDGETITLEDAAWQVWRTGVGMVEGLACEAAVLRCLPDDLDDQGLLLAVPSSKEAYAILDHPAELSQAFGVPVRKRFAMWIDAANRVRTDTNKATA